MQTARYIYYEDDGLLVGWLQEHPDYRTQGATRAELEENLLDIYTEVSSDRIPYVRKVGELRVA